jgi:Tat protein secretion system quality control protein TatD with DNase activity
VALVGEKIAEVLGLPISEVAAATTASAQRFYGVSAQ